MQIPIYQDNREYVSSIPYRRPALERMLFNQLLLVTGAILFAWFLMCRLMEGFYWMFYLPVAFY